MLRFALSAVLLACLCVAADRPRLRPLPAVDQNVKTGPDVGARIPNFAAVDQNGKRQTFQTLRGPHGLALLFVRSADW
jgi:hypothetical protein